MEIPVSDFGRNKIDIHGMLDFDERGDGLSPRRLPAWTRLQLPQPFDVMARMPSGVRIRFATDSAQVGLRFQTTRLVEKRDEPRDVLVNVETDGQLLAATATGGSLIRFNRDDPKDFELERGSESQVSFTLPGSGMREVQVWLPHNAYVEIRGLALDDQASVAAYTTEQRRWIHYGSSISHCMEALQPALTWPAVAARQGGVELMSLGFGGQCHLDQFVARTIRDLKPDIISMKLGINVVNGDTMRERTFMPAVHGFLDTIREGLPETKILIVSPIFCPPAEENPGPTRPNEAGITQTYPGMEDLREGCLTLTRIRTILERVVTARDDSNLAYLSGLELFSSADSEDLPDDLHPNAAGYIRMGERFATAAFAPGKFLSAIN